VTAINLPRSPLARLGARWGKATVQIMGANIAAQVIGLFTAIFLTYFMAVSTYGRYALAVFYASLLTHIINSGLLQGAFLTVFGAGGDDDDDGGDDDSESALINAEWFDRRRFLTTSLLATLLIGCFWVALSVIFAAPLSNLIFRSPNRGYLLILAAVSGALGGVWRYAVNLMRVERRILLYCVCRTTRSIFVFVAIAILMPMNPNSIRAALFALIIGTVASLIPILAMTYRSYRLAVHPWDFAIAFRNGLPYIPITLFSGFVHSAGVYLLGGFRGPSVVGEYSIASSLSSVNAHYVSGFLSSFSPIKRTSVFFAAKHEGDQYRYALINLFAGTALWLFVAIALLATEIIKVLPARYHGAGPLIPYAMLGWTAYGFYMVTYRTSEMNYKRKIYVTVSVLSAALYVGLSRLLDPMWGGAGQGAAMGATYLVIGSIILFFSQRGEAPLPVNYGRIAIAAAVTGAWTIGFLRLARTFPAWQLEIEVAGVILFAVVPLICGLVPWRMVMALKAVIREIIPRRGTIRGLQKGIDQLRPDQALILRSLGRAQDPSEQAASLGMSEAEFEIRAVAAMRELVDLGGPRACDVRIGAYLLSAKSMAERDVLARKLRLEIDSGEIDLLETTIAMVRKAARQREQRRLAWLRALGAGRRVRELPSGPTLALPAGEEEAVPGLNAR
jgi:O-antigen/teichoic acid export membrane protein